MRFKPRTQTEHEGPCELAMACPICTLRCYDGFPGHLFRNGDGLPCDCGQFSSIEDWKKSIAPEQWEQLGKIDKAHAR